MLVVRTPFEEINRFRKALGLKPIVRKMTNCLSCKKEFVSSDYPRQRLCSNCRTDTDDFSSYDTPYRQDLFMVG
jgi:hypothetical protein